MTAARQARADYGPVQLAVFLGLEQWQFARARQAGLIGAPDLARGRWSAAAAAAALARAGQIRAGRASTGPRSAPPRRAASPRSRGWPKPRPCWRCWPGCPARRCGR